MTITTQSYERDAFPRCTATLDSATGALSCVIDQIVGLAPVRFVSAEELLFGIDSLNPPAVHSDSVRGLIELAQQAVEAAVTSTLGPTTSPGEMMLCRYKVTVVVNGALELLGLSV